MNGVIKYLIKNGVRSNSILLSLLMIAKGVNLKLVT